jgi:replication factor C subunit 3/5
MLLSAMFLVDKYNISNIDDIIIHKDIYNNLIIGSNQNNRQRDLDELKDIIKNKRYDLIDKFHFTKPKIYKKYEKMSHLLVHGPPGCGKNTFVKLLLKDIYDDTVNDTFIETYLIKGYGNSPVEQKIEQSKYHLVIEPNNTGLDKYLIQEIVKEYAKKNIVNVSYNKYQYRTVLINNIDNLNYYAQTSLRCTMEKYHKTCRFILCGNQISKIIDPIRSRCLDIRIPAPTYNDMINLIYHIMLHEKNVLPRTKIDEIINAGGFNIKKTLWILDLSRYGINDYELSWKKSLDKLVEFMVLFKKPDISQTVLNDQLIPTVRNILYNIFTTNVPGINILHEIINKIIDSKQFDANLLHNIIQVSSETETRLNKGKRSIIHLDYFMCETFRIIYNHHKLK